MRLYDVNSPYRIHMRPLDGTYFPFQPLIRISPLGAQWGHIYSMETDYIQYVQLVQRYIVAPVVKSFVWLLEVEVNLQVLLIQNDS